MKHTKFNLRILFFFFAFFMAASQFASAQALSFEDSEDEEEVNSCDESEAWDVAPGRHDEVMIRVNGDEFPLGDEIRVKRKDVLDIKVRYMKPASSVVLHMKKGGINLKKKAFYANEKGQLDLEVKTGNKKVKGTATVYYTPSNGKKKERNVRIIVE